MRRRGRERLVGAGLVLALMGSAAAAADVVRLRPLVRDGRLLVSFELTGAFTEPVRQAVASGLSVLFLYEVVLQEARPWWFDRTIATTLVTTSIRYDTLRREYLVSRLLDGRVDETRVTTDEAAVRRFATVFEQFPLFSTAPLEPNGEYYVRVQVQTRPRDGWLRWPWDRTVASARAGFTYLP